MKRHLGEAFTLYGHIANSNFIGAVCDYHAKVYDRYSKTETRGS